jgi:hypothetical protein
MLGETRQEEGQKSMKDVLRDWHKGLRGGGGGSVGSSGKGRDGARRKKSRGGTGEEGKEEWEEVFAEAMQDKQEHSRDRHLASLDSIIAGARATFLQSVGVNGGDVTAPPSTSSSLSPHIPSAPPASLDGPPGDGSYRLGMGGYQYGGDVTSQQQLERGAVGSYALQGERKRVAAQVKDSSQTRASSHQRGGVSMRRMTSQRRGSYFGLYSPAEVIERQEREEEEAVAAGGVYGYYA